MKKIITLIILVGAFFVGAYTSESAETDKYAYIVVPMPLDENAIVSKPVAYIYRINKKTDKKEVAEIEKNYGETLDWMEVREY
jgi:hypothetical protein